MLRRTSQIDRIYIYVYICIHIYMRFLYAHVCILHAQTNKQTGAIIIRIQIPPCHELGRMFCCICVCMLDGTYIHTHIDSHVPA
jgi:hypothetical protein